MREIETITGSMIQADCLSCAIASGPLVDYPGTIYRSEHFHAHQDIEILLPGFVIVSTIRHIASVMDLSYAESIELACLLPKIRRAQSTCGLLNVYLFQQEDTLDHFHIWMFPVYNWMKPFGEGPQLITRAMNALKGGCHTYDRGDVLAVVNILKTNLTAIDG